MWRKSRERDLVIKFWATGSCFIGVTLFTLGDQSQKCEFVLILTDLTQ